VARGKKTTTHIIRCHENQIQFLIPSPWEGSASHTVLIILYKRVSCLLSRLSLEDMNSRESWVECIKDLIAAACTAPVQGINKAAKF